LPTGARLMADASKVEASNRRVTASVCRPPSRSSSVLVAWT